VEKIEDGGDIAVLRGTDVRLKITPTMKTPGGRIAVNDKESVPLTLQSDGTLTASFKAAGQGFYRVELDTPTGEHVAASPQYTIDVLSDQAPTVSFNKPGRDTSASPIEELFVEASAEDDFGVRDLELVYSVNGGDEKTVKLFGRQPPLPEVSAGHTFYLEELNVQPGDSVSYYARATDNDAVGGTKPATSDIYFVRIRPFSKDFRQAQSQGGGGAAGGGGGGGGQVDALSEQQKQIVSATFNVDRKKKTLTPQKLRESAKVVELSQSKVREQVEGLLTRHEQPAGRARPGVREDRQMLPQAVSAMKEAEGQLASAKCRGAEARTEGAADSAEGRRGIRDADQRPAPAGRRWRWRRWRRAAAGAGGMFEQELDQMASRYETASQAASSRPIARSTSCSRS
jgi:hypothetical protein